MHLWLTPFTADGDHFIELQFEASVKIAMIRIWVHFTDFLQNLEGRETVTLVELSLFLNIYKGVLSSSIFDSYQ